jgi:tRNA A-37 threonylcarbamoyl transferase component Bud32
MERLTNEQIDKIIFSSEITDKKLNELVKELTPYKSGNNGIVYKFIGVNGKTYILKEHYADNNLDEIEYQNQASKLHLAPHIYKFGEYGDKFFSVMDYVDGVTLKKYIKNNENISEILNKVLDKIEVLHNNEIIHGDLNFGNIMIDKDENVFFIDFLNTYDYDQHRKIFRDYLGFMYSLSYYLPEEKNLKKYEDIFYEIYNQIIKYDINDIIKNKFERRIQRYISTLL